MGILGHFVNFLSHFDMFFELFNMNKYENQIIIHFNQLFGNKQSNLFVLIRRYKTLFDFLW